MKIDSTHRAWMRSTLALATFAAAIYILYVFRAGPMRGGSVPGLVFGIAGYFLMVFAALLGLRKKYPLLRVGRAATWMRGHLWLGFLSFPLILFHAGFSANGTLAAWLMGLMIAVIATGVTGALLQHYLPALMTRLVPLETIYEEIPKIREQLRREADKLAAPLLSPSLASNSISVTRPGAPNRASIIELEAEEMGHFRDLYASRIQKFLAQPNQGKNECADSEQSSAMFAALRLHLPETVHPVLADLEHICEEARQLNRQELIYRYLHGWLLIHVPLSLALILLGGIHAVVALWY